MTKPVKPVKSGKSGTPGAGGASAGTFRLDVNSLFTRQGNAAGAGVSFVGKTQPLFDGPTKQTIWEAVQMAGRGHADTRPATPSFATLPKAPQKAFTLPAQKPPVEKGRKGRAVRKGQPRQVTEKVWQFSSAARPESFQTSPRQENPLVKQRWERAFTQGQSNTIEIMEMVKMARLAKLGVREQDLTAQQLEMYLTPRPSLWFPAPTWDPNYQTARDALFQFNGNIARDSPKVAAAKKAERKHWTNNLGTIVSQAYTGAMTTSNAVDTDLAGDPAGAAFQLYNADKSQAAAFGRGFSDNLGPSAGGAFGAGMGASALGMFGTLVGGVAGGIIGGIGGGIGGGYLGDAGVRRLQDAALKSSLSSEAYRALMKLRQEDLTERGGAYGGGQLASQVVLMQPKSLGEIRKEGSLLLRMSRRGGPAAERAAYQRALGVAKGNEAFAGAVGRLFGDGVGVALPLGQELLSAYQEGRPINSVPFLLNAGLTLFTKNNGAGDALYTGGSIVGTGAANVVPHLAHKVVGTVVPPTNRRTQPPASTHVEAFQVGQTHHSSEGVPLEVTAKSADGRLRVPGDTTTFTVAPEATTAPGSAPIATPGAVITAPGVKPVPSRPTLFAARHSGVEVRPAPEAHPAGETAPFLVEVTDKDTLRSGLLQTFGVSEETASHHSERVDRVAQTWSQRNGRPPTEWYRENVPLLGRGNLDIAHKMVYQNDVHDARQRGLSEEQARAWADGRRAYQEEQARKLAGAFAPASLFTGDANDTRKVLAALTNPDAYVALHELGHSFLEQLLRESPLEAAQIARWATGGRSDKIDNLVAERFAKAHERFDPDNIELPTSTKRVVNRFTRWLADVYDRIVYRGRVDGAAGQRVLELNPATLAILAKHHGTEVPPEVARQLTQVREKMQASPARFDPFNPFRRGSVATSTGMPLPPLLARVLGLPAGGTVQQPLVSPTLFAKIDYKPAPPLHPVPVKGYGEATRIIVGTKTKKGPLQTPLVPLADHRIDAKRQYAIVDPESPIEKLVRTVDLQDWFRNGNVHPKNILPVNTDTYDKMVTGGIIRPDPLLPDLVLGSGQGGVLFALTDNHLLARLNGKPVGVVLASNENVLKSAVRRGLELDSQLKIIFVGADEMVMSNKEFVRAFDLLIRERINRGMTTMDEVNDRFRVALKAAKEEDKKAAPKRRDQKEYLEDVTEDTTYDQWIQMLPRLRLEAGPMVWQKFGDRDNFKAKVTPYYLHLARAMSDPRFNMKGSGHAVALGKMDLPYIPPNATGDQVQQIINQHVYTAAQLGISPGHISYNGYLIGEPLKLLPKYIHRTELLPQYTNKQTQSFMRHRPAFTPTPEFIEWQHDLTKGELSGRNYIPGWSGGSGNAAP